VTAAANDTVPAWWSLGLIAVGLWGLHSLYRALTSGEVSGGKAPIWGSVRYYDRAIAPVRFWFMVALNLAGASAMLIIGLVLLLAT
jgi:hypothetical protein